MSTFEIVVSIFGLAVTIILGVTGYNFSKKKDDREDTKETRQETKEWTELKMELKYINEKITENFARITENIRNLSDKYEATYERVVKVEQSSNSAHKRIDENIPAINERLTKVELKVDNIIAKNAKG